MTMPTANPESPRAVADKSPKAIGGLLIATVVGYVLQRTDSYVVPFFIAGSAYLLALAAVHLLAPRLEPAHIATENKA